MVRGPRIVGNARDGSKEQYSFIPCKHQFEVSDSVLVWVLAERLTA